MGNCVVKRDTYGLQVSDDIKVKSMVERGDFMFVRSKYEQIILEHDFNCIENLEDGWAMMETIDLHDVYIERESPWNTPNELWETIVEYMYPGHTKDSLKNSVYDLAYIAHYGWDEYVAMKSKLYE